MSMRMEIITKQTNQAKDSVSDKAIYKNQKRRLKLKPRNGIVALGTDWKPPTKTEIVGTGKQHTVQSVI